MENSEKDTQVEVKSFGCSANFGEGEVIKGILRRDGFNLSETPELEGPTEVDSNPLTSQATTEASQSTEGLDKLLVLNVCTVKGDHGPIKEVKKALEEDPDRKIVIGGCVTKSLATTVQKLDSRISVTTTHGVSQITQAVESTLGNQPIMDLKKKEADRINLPRVRSNPAVGIVPVCSGCLDRCSFCSTVAIKGKLKSYPIESITQEVAELVADGCKEIWLTGQDAACYGFDIDTNLAKLVRELVLIPGDFKIRLGMGNPRHLLVFWEELAEVLKHPKVFKFIHLPVQSGSSTVLEGMKRKHSVDDYYFLVNKFREVVPDLTISTDIIVGFPGETEEDFLQTLELINKTKPSVVNRTRYVPREGTVAHGMEDIPGAVKKDRSRRLTEQFKEIVLGINETWVGWKGSIIIDEYGKNSGTMMGRNDFYKPVIVEGQFQFGDQVDVEVYEADTFCLLAKVI